MQRETGSHEEVFIQSHRARAFIPHSLPPEPPLQWLPELSEERLQTLGRAAGTALRVHELLQQRPILSVPNTVAALEISWSAANNAMTEMEKLEIVREITGQRRNRLYAYNAYLDLLAEGTEPLD